jgi:hypothetical protein
MHAGGARPWVPSWPPPWHSCAGLLCPPSSAPALPAFLCARPARLVRPCTSGPRPPAPPPQDHSGTVGPPLPVLSFRLEAVPEMNYDPLASPPR